MRAAAVATGRGLVFEHRVASGSVRAVDEVDLDIRSARLTALTGPTGSGKSTLLRMLGGMDRPSAGSLVVAGSTLSGGARARRRHRRRAVGFVTQVPSEGVVAHLDGLGNLHLVGIARGFGSPLEARLDALAAVGLDGRADVTADRLSGGEQQRLSVAMACFGSPAVLLCDEPTAELDRSSAQVVITALVDASRAGVTVVVCTHDPDLVAVADDLIHLERGRVVGGA